MIKQSFALEESGDHRLEIVWEKLYKNGVVSIDGQEIGVLPDQKTLYQGLEYDLPDGSMLSFRLVKQLTSTEFHVLRDGKPLPGSTSDPQIRLANAYTTVYIIAGFNLLLGLVSVLLNIQFLQQLGIGFSSILFGLLFLALGYLVQRKSSLALIVAVVVFVINDFANFIYTAAQGHGLSNGGLVIMIGLLVPMFQGFGAIEALKRKI
ncbi:MAG: hypothetical protein KME07_00975 [Pegethrix bostrychoides GSE-TBD4-15B]|jgi:hypothetical protein|uniref:Uncharacterized protein n=1 Tax=Pegethrix bostrychoides GSE-TBD4-15B TaxID=2839662 RepID=A0A951P7F4_9CYAN|nr:hypothetical protein [Pegethrix bostrychoides GSE-TBD4-15B]